MSDIETIIADRVAELRHAFDRSFAQPLVADERETVDLITLKVAEKPYAIRMSEIGGLFADVKVTPCPGPLRELRGIAGFRGALVPVYDLAMLLGHPAGESRWVVLAREAQVALAFAGFDGHVRVEPGAIAAEGPGAAVGHVSEIVRIGVQACPIISIPSLVAAIRQRSSSHGATSKE